MKSYMYMIAIPFALLVIGMLALTFSKVSNNKTVVTESKAVTQVNH